MTVGTMLDRVNVRGKEMYKDKTIVWCFHFGFAGHECVAGAML